MKYIKHLSPIIFLLIIAFGCTKKDNPTGYPGNEFQPKEIVISDTSLFGNFYSYEDSCRNFNNNPKLLIGNYRNTQAISLLKFTSLPDTVSEISSDVTLTLY
ncbi:MAG TPA: hypothetical protein ENL20_05040, partial [Candidatus Cloacimonetes bacterium]|nr:hypothetical protein [Candidatus Cloacimonadota bacterium]